MNLKVYKPRVFVTLNWGEVLHKIGYHKESSFVISFMTLDNSLVSAITDFVITSMTLDNSPASDITDFVITSMTLLTSQTLS